NSADHGLETPEERRAAGKPEKGVIRLSAFHEGGHIIVEIADDGRGLNLDRIRAKARDNGLATEADLAKMSDNQVYRFIFHAGFSTAAKVTSVSGRGVGMDVVRSNIDQIGGTVDVRSTKGNGSTFTIKIPLTLAIMPALIVEAGGERFAIPQLAVIELVAIQTMTESNIERIKDAPVLRLRDKLLPIVSLGQLLEGGTVGGDAALETGFIAVVQVGHRKFGLAVDAVLHTEEIVIKPMASMLRDIPMYSGSTILGDGRVIPIIDPNGIARSVESAVDQVEQEAAGSEAELAEAAGSISLLLFRAGTPEPRAVPLSLVTRLEEIDAAAIERANGRSVTLYRGTLIPLVFVNGAPPNPESGRLPMLVFNDKGRAMGLIVDEIVDIVHETVAVEIPSDAAGSLGAAVIAGKATEVLDIGYYLAQAFPNWFERKAPVKGTARGRLLVVDDDPIFRKLIDPVIRSSGYSVTLLGSAQAALSQIAAGERFDVVVSDLDMPLMDGFQFAEALRQDSRHRDTPLIALSSICSDEARERGREAGFTHHIAKSDRAGLVAALGNVNDERLGEAA
ncbi:MAG: chemotaxis protein CheW, partial [Rhizobiales bacterium]|nr:chemotaxis protein CheW [Hyphomicrobiales bacterium]